MQGYRKWLQTTAEDLLESIGAAENVGWHHAAPGTLEFQTYLRMATWLDELAERMVRYDHTRKARAGLAAKAADREARHEMDRYLGGPRLGDRSPEQLQSPESGERGRHAGADPGTDADPTVRDAG